MRLGAKLLTVGATKNSYKTHTQIYIQQGETLDLVFQFVDEDQSGLRYLPGNTATVLVEIARFVDVFGTISNQRTSVDYSVRVNAAKAFPAEDNSIWKIPLTATQTNNMMSSDIRITLTEGSTVLKSYITQGIVVRSREGAP